MFEQIYFCITWRSNISAIFFFFILEVFEPHLNFYLYSERRKDWKTTQINRVFSVSSECHSLCKHKLSNKAPKHRTSIKCPSLLRFLETLRILKEKWRESTLKQARCSMLWQITLARYMNIENRIANQKQETMSC